jgi:hypothetical protein
LGGTDQKNNGSRPAWATMLVRHHSTNEPGRVVLESLIPATQDAYIEGSGLWQALGKNMRIYQKNN